MTSSRSHSQKAEVQVDVTPVVERALNPQWDELCFSVTLLQETRFIFTDFHKMRHRKFTVLMPRMEAHVIVPNPRSTSESLNKLCAEHPSLNQMNTHIHLSNSPHFEDHCSSSSLLLIVDFLT